MPQEYRVLSAERSDGPADQYGNIAYWIEVEGDEQNIRALLKQNPDTPAPGGTIFGRIEELTSKKTGKQYFRFRKERREDHNGAAPTHSGQGDARRGSSGGGSPGPEFWAAKDRRLARAGMTQAVVQAMGGPNLAHNPLYDLDKWVADVARTTDALLEDLERRAPSPNNSPGAMDSSSAGAGDHSASPEPPGGREAAPTPAAPVPDFVNDPDYKLALAACGHDNSDPAKTYESLNPDEKGQVKTIYQNLANKGEATIPDTGAPLSDPDSEIPF